jgi:zinc protease
VGDVEADQVFKLIASHYSGWRPYEGEREPIPEEPKQTQSRRQHIDWPTPTAPRITMAWRIPGHSPNSAALQLIADLLGSKTSGLYQRLVLKNPLAYGISVNRMALVDPSLFLIAVELKEGAAFGEAEQIIREELAALEASVDTDLLQRIKTKQKYKLLSSLDTPAAVASTLGWELRRLGTLDVYERYLANYQSVSGEGIRAAIEAHLRDPGLNVVTLRHKPAEEESP